MEEASEYSGLGRHQSCSEERIEVLSNTIERYHSSRNTSSLLYPESVRMETGEIIFEKVHASPRPLPKISLKHDWMKELGSEVVQRPDGQVVNNLKVPNQTNQIQTQIMMIELRNPLFAVTQVTRKVPTKHVHLMAARASTLKIKPIMIERGSRCLP